MSLNMNGDNVSETSIIFSTLCNDTKNSLDNKGYSPLRYHQITTAQNELISIQRSLIRELLKNSKEFQEKFGNNFNTKNSNHQEQQSNKGGVECDAMHIDVESIRDEICFVKSFRDLVKGSNGKEIVDNNMKFGNGVTIENSKKSYYKFNQDQIEEDDKDTGFIYPENPQNHYSSQTKENDNFIDTTNSFNICKEAAEGGSMNIINNVPFINEFPKGRSDFGPNDSLQSQSTSTPFQNNDYYNETNETNGDFFGEFRGFNSIYVGTRKENIDVHQLKQCLEENFGRVRFIRIIRNKNCAFAEFEEKQCFEEAIEVGYVPLNGVNLKINKTFRKKKDNKF